ncbi:MAG: hypothetical protein WBQ23_06880 [Bacteroidota bacterium]
MTSAARQGARLFFHLILLFGFTQSAAAQIFPDTVYAWRKTAERVLAPEEWKTALGNRAAALEAFGTTEFRVINLFREGKNVRIEIALLPSRERAFGLFRSLSDAGTVNGIVGDAFAYERSAVNVNTGPYYFRIVSEEKRAAQPPDEALVLRTRRVLYTKADCYGSDFPLPTDERVLGSERYLVPDEEVWQVFRTRVPEGLLPVLSTHAAFTAEYEKPHAGVRRTLMLFPFRQKDAAAAFAAELVQQLEARAGSRSEACAIPAFVRGGVQRVIAADATRVFLIISDSGDSGCCEWARSLLRR